MANDLVAVLSDVQHGFALEIRPIVVVTQDEASRHILHRQIMDHERFANVWKKVRWNESSFMDELNIVQKNEDSINE